MRGLFELDEFVMEYCDMKVDENLTLYETNDLDTMKEVFEKNILRSAVRNMVEDESLRPLDAIEAIIRDEELIEELFGFAVESSRFGCCA